ncbi:hypothetical protein BJX66DRAFT_225505 [Aspergillus keveii]|uniref:Uncharacterized protein n=1 Tax=Aspergillus keveii TaxID=714993 RepID=A0ABR4G317_9EURO
MRMRHQYASNIQLAICKTKTASRPRPFVSSSHQEKFKKREGVEDQGPILLQVVLCHVMLFFFSCSSLETSTKMTGR